MRLLELAAERGIDLSPNVRRVAEAFGDGREALQALDVWDRLNTPDRPLARVTVYRAFTTLAEKGLIAVSAVVGSRAFYQIDMDRPLVHLVDVARSELRTIAANDLVRDIERLVDDAGYRLAGVELRVLPRADGSPVERKKAERLRAPPLQSDG